MNHLPTIRGKYRQNADLASTTWFRVGGVADTLFKPADTQDLADFLKAYPAGAPLHIIGVGSNLLVRDGGIPGVVIRLGGGEFSAMQADAGAHTITAGAGCLDGNIALLAQQHGIGGLEFLSGIPGTLGGALAMNAGAYGTEIKDILVNATAVTRHGEILTLTPEALHFTYRHMGYGEPLFFTAATLRGVPEQPDVIAARMADIQQQRGSTQPVKSRTGGSTFANPEGHKAWQLIDAAGCRGLTFGGAQMSELHCNFMINTGTATAADLEQLGESVRARVKAYSGIELRWEIQRLGQP